ncbi:MAG: radical SAM protein, partial [Candidatus Heimdallarchaeota archaeon]|nr:radical SAM protein [Candidatus Heimdallarchaeota archaeon]
MLLIMIFIPSQEKHVKKCFICNEEKLVASILSVCKDCLRKRTTKVAELIMNAHKRARSPYNLPVTAPDNDRISCSLCNHNCGIDENETSYCGLRFRDNNAKISTYSTKEMGLLHNYLDPLPCNCCAAWFCPAGTGDGYPEYASSQGKELGFYNLSIFFYGCSFDCL